MRRTYIVTTEMQMRADLEVRCGPTGRRGGRRQGVLTGPHVMSRPARK